MSQNNKEIEDWDSIDVQYVTPRRLAEMGVEAAEEDADEVMLIEDVDVEALVEEYQAEQAEPEEEDDEEEELEAPWNADKYGIDEDKSYEEIIESAPWNQAGDDE